MKTERNATEKNVTKRNGTKSIIGVIALMAVVAVMFFAYKALAPKTEAGNKEIQIMVIHGDGKNVTFDYKTDLEYLGELLQERGLIEGEVRQYGFYILTADGETVDESKQQWWCITKGGEMVMTGAEKTPISDGDIFELTFTEGYEEY